MTVMESSECTFCARFWGASAIPARAYLPHRDESYGLSSGAVHQFSLRGTDLLITVDNGINSHREVLLAERLGIDVIVIDHHRIQEQANTLAVWSQEFCGAGLRLYSRLLWLAVQAGRISASRLCSRR